MNQKIFEDLLESLTSTPSAHNVQPLRVRWSADEPLLLKIAVQKDRLLPYADPHRRDLQMTAGALVEGISIYLSSLGYRIDKISDWNLDKPRFQGVLQMVLIQDPKVQQDLLFSQVPLRYSYRGKFAKNNSGPSYQQPLARTEGVTVIENKELINQVAELYDKVNYSFLRKPGYLTELYSWMRFSVKHPNWLRDGLNSDSIALKGIEALGASFILKPKVFDVLAKLGLAATLISEAPLVNSASALVVITSSQGVSHLEQGRQFYRVWLQMTMHGIFGAALSLLADDPVAKRQVLEWSGLSVGERDLINVFRVGPIPSTYERYQRARLGSSELELKAED